VRVAGVMSGTSLDGIDVAIVEINGPRVSTIGFQSTPYSEKCAAPFWPSRTRPPRRARSRGSIFSWASSTPRRPARLPPLRAGRADRLPRPDHLSRRRRQHIADRRSGGDCGAHRSAGGLRFPHARYRRRRPGRAAGAFRRLPAVRHPRRTRIALNIGGIANITVIRGARGSGRVRYRSRQHGDRRAGARVHGRPAKFRPRRPHRRARQGGSRAARPICWPIRTTAKAAQERRARTIRRGIRGTLEADRLPLPDLIATATVLTAATIAMAATAPLPAPDELIVSGGGAHNPQILAHLAAFLPGVAIALRAEVAAGQDRFGNGGSEHQQHDVPPEALRRLVGRCRRAGDATLL
jgi:anhydro-N-acetylmuramic acid kinase